MRLTECNEGQLEHWLTTPSQKLTDDMRKLSGDIVILGAGGKMGPTMAILAQRAINAGGGHHKVIAVSRFSETAATAPLTQHGIECVACDMLTQPEALPDAAHVIFMAGRKFGTAGQEALTWEANALLPALIAERYRDSRIAVFSSANVYPRTPADSGGCTEDTPPQPEGEYAMSVLARERIFECAAYRHRTKISIIRLAYAIDLRYGVLCDIAMNIMQGLPISTAVPSFNCIWQGDANEAALRSLLYADDAGFILNVTGPETVPVKETALKLARLLGKEPVFAQEESDGKSLLCNAGKMFQRFGYPSVPLETLIEAQAAWLKNNGRVLHKPTHFEERKGRY